MLLLFVLVLWSAKKAVCGEVCSSVCCSQQASTLLLQKGSAAHPHKVLYFTPSLGALPEALLLAARERPAWSRSGNKHNKSRESKNT